MARNFLGGRASGGSRMTREAVVLAEREKYVSMSLEEKRREYKCGIKYITLDNVPTWSKLSKSEKQKRLDKSTGTSGPYHSSKKLNDIVTIWKGDITKLEIDVIANAANNSLLGGGGVDGAIHAAAGSGLREECAMLAGCDTGEAKITGGYKLPAKYVIHTVGPIGEKETKLRSCYTNCLRLLKESKSRSLAFPCISTGVYGYPNLPAAHVALGTTRKWLDTDNNSDLVDRIVFCLFLPKDVSIYKDLLYQYFPPATDTEDNGAEDNSEEGLSREAGDHWEGQGQLQDAPTVSEEDSKESRQPGTDANSSTENKETLKPTDHGDTQVQQNVIANDENSTIKQGCDTTIETDKKR